MLTVSAAARLAIETSGRHLELDAVATISGSGAFDQLDARATSYATDRAARTTLAAGTTYIEGLATGRLKITCKGADLVRALSPHSLTGDLPTGGVIGQPIAVDMFVADSICRRFTGKIRTNPIDVGAGLVSFECIDASGDYGTDVELPLFANDNPGTAATFGEKPGLNASWVVAYILGTGPTKPYYRDDDECLAVSCAGSLWPDHGTFEGGCALPWAADVDASAFTTIARPPRFVDGDHLPAVIVNDADWKVFGRYAIAPGIDYRNGWTTRLVASVAEAGDTGTLFTLRGSAGGVFSVMARLKVTAAGNLALDFTRRNNVTAPVTVTGPAFSPGVEHEIVAVINPGSGTSLVTSLYVDGVLASATTTITAYSSGSTAFYGEVGSWTAGDVGEGTATVSSVTVVPGVLTATRDAMLAFDSPTQICLSDLDLITIPTTTGAGADLIRTIAQAEYAYCGWDEEGQFAYLTQQQIKDRRGTTAVKTLDAQANTLQTTTDLDAVRNKVSVPYTPYALEPLTPVWTASETYALGGGQTRTLTVQLRSPALDILIPAATPITDNSEYAANTLADGKGSSVTNLAFGIEVFAQSATITYTNPNPYTVYLVWPDGSVDDEGRPKGGRPALFLAGRPLVAGDGGVAVGVEQGSVDLYGLRSLDVPGSPWRQLDEVAHTVKSRLLGDYAYIRPTIRSMQIVGDPSLQLLDVVWLADPKYLDVSDPFRIVGLADDWSNGYGQVIDLIPLGQPNGWILQDPVRGVLGITTRL